MRRNTHRFIARGLFSPILVSSFIVILLMLATLYVGRGRQREVALAAGRGLDAPDIEMLERQNQAYERIIQATTPGIVYIRTEQVVKAEQSPMFMDPMFQQFFGNGSPQVPQDQKQHALGTSGCFRIQWIHRHQQSRNRSRQHSRDHAWREKDSHVFAG
jgi:S1-C subfamily serine protease